MLLECYHTQANFEAHSSSGTVGNATLSWD